MKIFLKILSLLLTFLGAAMVFINDVISGFSELLKVTEAQVKTYGLITFIVSVIFFMLLAVIQDIMKEISRPKIKPMGEPIWEQKGFSGNIIKEALSIDFVNNGKEVASNVSAHVVWKNMMGTVIHRNNGRWHKTNRQIGIGQPLEHIDIFPNGEKHKLHFAIKSDDGNSMYAWFREKDEEAPLISLEQNKYEVEIYLVDGNGIKSKTFKYLIENKPNNKKEVSKKRISSKITKRQNIPHRNKA